MLGDLNSKTVKDLGIQGNNHDGTIAAGRTAALFI